MIVCSCNRLSDRDVRRVCANGGICQVQQVYRRLGCGKKCGRCVPTMTALLKEAQKPEDGFGDCDCAIADLADAAVA